MNRNLFSLDDMSLRGLIVDLLRSFWMIILAAAAMWCLATSWHLLTYEPEYSSSATLVVAIKGDSSAYTSLSTASSMAGVFSQVFQSDVLKDTIIEDVGENIQGRLSCSLVESTNLLVLTATSSRPRDAYLYIQSALRNYDSAASQVFSNASLEIVQEPDVPALPSNASWILNRRNLLTVFAAVAMAGVIALCYVLRFTVKTPKGAQRQLDGRILGVIPYERKGILLRKAGNSKQALTLNSPMVSMDFAETTRRVESKLEYYMRGQDIKVLLSTSVGENEGKSTVAANLALSLAEKGNRVLLIDGDLRKPALNKVFDAPDRPEHSFHRVLTGEAGWRQTVHYNKQTKILELFQYGLTSDPGRLLRQNQLKTLLDQCKREVDYVIVDCSPMSVSADAEKWLSCVDGAVLVVREDWAGVRAINDAVDTIWQCGTDFAGFILNAFHEEWTGGSRYGYRYEKYRYSGSNPNISTKERGNAHGSTDQSC